MNDAYNRIIAAADNAGITTRDKRIHNLFNELHDLLSDDTSPERELLLADVCDTIDAAHHDFTELMLDNPDRR